MMSNRSRFFFSRLLLRVLPGVVAALILSASILFAKRDAASALDENAIVPKPVAYDARKGKFVFKKTTKIVAANPRAVPVAEYFAKEFKTATGIALKTDTKGGSGSVRLEIKKNPKLGAEGYSMDVKTTGILISAPEPAGLFYGLQTLRQMMPPEIYSRKPVSLDEWSVPCAKITDYPRFAWRGANIDCGRHFYSKEAIKRFIDALSWHKLNRFHWHLTEDQGWRIEIKKYPRLTEIGAWRSNVLKDGGANFEKQDSPDWNKNGQYGGFYSQKDIREIVKYAQERFVTVVPEIEFPGHSRAALTAYPEYSCSGKAPGIPLHGGVFAEVYCPGKEKTFKFLTDILEEVCALFPSEYIHIGGDECPKSAWKKCADCQKRIRTEKLVGNGKRTAEDLLQSYTIARIQKFLEAKGRKIIAWDEITEGGIPEGCTVMHWREYTDVKIAPRNGNDLIVAMRPTCYYNWAYSADDKPFILSQGSVMPMKQAYNFDPMPKGLSEKEQKHVLGTQACFWSEKSPNPLIMEFHYFPRMSAISENAWGNRENRNYADFLRRVKIQGSRYKFAGINARPSAEDPLPADYKVFEKYDLSKIFKGGKKKK